MKSRNNALHLVKERFPQHAEHIENLFRSNEHFHELCLDYQLCVQYLEKFIEDEAEKKAWIHEYGNLRTNLEDELVYFLSKHKVINYQKSFAVVQGGK